MMSLAPDTALTYINGRVLKHDLSDHSERFAPPSGLHALNARTARLTFTLSLLILGRGVLAEFLYIYSYA